MADILSIGLIRYFNVYDKQTRKLKYSKKNFNFYLYKKDFNLLNKTKLEIFDHFLIANNSAFFNEPSFPNKGTTTPSYLKPTTLKEEFKKYFTPMTQQIINFNNLYGFTVHPGYMNVQDPSTYVSITRLVKEQFDLVYYKPDQLRKLQDYYYSDKQGVYSKYNFNFKKFSEDFNVYGNNLVIFTDFISRVIYSSGSYIGAYGYGIPYGFRKYFIQSQGLDEYLNKYGTSSIYKNVAYKNEYSIDYKEYAKQAKLGDVSEETAKEHYMRSGQFIQYKIKFINEPLSSKEENINAICTIYTSKGIGSGFLYKNKNNIGDTNIYVVTCSHIFNKENLSTFYASFSLYDNTRENISTKAQFRVMGRDSFTDICLGIYDPELPYNKSFKPDLRPYKKLNINLTPKYKIGEDVYTCGNLGSLDNNSLLKGSIMDPKYGGDFTVDSTYIPESLLIDMRSDKGMSGSPIFQENNDSEVIGIILGSTSNKNYKLSLTGFLLENLVTNIIARYKAFSVIYKNDPINFEIATGRAVTRRWLGCVTSYYHPQFSPQLSNSLTSFPYTGGLVLHDFILGLNNDTKEYVFNTKTLQEDNVTKLDGPLLKSKLYNRFIDSGKNPIVLKTATFIQGWIGQYAKYNFGKYGNQDAYYNFTYGFSDLGTMEVPKDKGTNSLAPLLGNLELEYYYFDGINWILEKEMFHHDDGESNYTSYNYLGNKYYDSKWSFPIVLYNYDESYINNIENEESFMLGGFQLFKEDVQEEEEEEEEEKENYRRRGLRKRRRGLRKRRIFFK